MRCEDACRRSGLDSSRAGALEQNDEQADKEQDQADDQYQLPHPGEPGVLFRDPGEHRPAQFRVIMAGLRHPANFCGAPFFEQPAILLVDRIGMRHDRLNL